jgi:lysophospholipase L1-like esterase
MATKLKSGESLLFIGDSITDCGRSDPQHAPFGCGYVRMLRDMLMTREPQKDITVINRGIGGNTVGDLRSRWQDDMLDHQPDWLSVMIGINDLNQTLCGQNDLLPEKFEENYDVLLTKTREFLPNCQILLMEPFYMSHDTNAESYRARVATVLPDYAAVVHRMSRKHKTRLLKSQQYFDAVLKYRSLDDLCEEPVHPNSAGHLLIAEAVYNALSQ